MWDFVNTALNYASIVSPSTAFMQGKKALPTFDAVEGGVNKVMQNEGVRNVTDGLKGMPVVGDYVSKGMDMAGSGFKLSKGAAQLGGDLFEGLF